MVRTIVYVCVCVCVRARVCVCVCLLTSTTTFRSTRIAKGMRMCVCVCTCARAINVRVYVRCVRASVQGVCKGCIRCKCVLWARVCVQEVCEGCACDVGVGVGVRSGCMGRMCVRVCEAVYMLPREGRGVNESNRQHFVTGDVAFRCTKQKK